MATTTDANLKNPWGVSFAPKSPFWVSDQATNVSSLYAGDGSKIAPVVVAVSGGPTGQVFNPTTGFVETDGKPATFIFSTLGGSIFAWNGGNGLGPTPPAPAQMAATVPNASFTGLAMASNGTGTFLYAANVTGTNTPVSVFDSSFGAITLSGSFQDPKLPAGYVPYNIQTINGQLYVEYANFAKGLGAVSVFDTNGNFIKELITAGDAHLNDPWGIVVAPSSFGTFANSLLVGNFGNGEINAFDQSTGAFLGTLNGPNGQPLVNDGLWALATRTGGTFDTNAVYFTAGINGQKDGLFGKLDPTTPEPASLGLGVIGILAITLFSARKPSGTRH